MHYIQIGEVNALYTDSERQELEAWSAIDFRIAMTKLQFARLASDKVDASGKRRMIARFHGSPPQKLSAGS